MNFQSISVKEIENYLGRPGTSLIDLRTREEYDLYHLEGARNIPYDDLQEYKQYLSKNMTLRPGSYFLSGTGDFYP